MSSPGPAEPNISPTDHFLMALAEAEYDDEPYTDEQRATAQAGWEEYQRGETIPWEEVRRELLEDDEASRNQVG